MWDSLIEFLRMDGFAVWVWSAFGLTAIVMLGGAILVSRQHRRALNQIKKLAHGGRS